MRMRRETRPDLEKETASQRRWTRASSSMPLRSVVTALSYFFPLFFGGVLSFFLGGARHGSALRANQVPSRDFLITFGAIFMMGLAQSGRCLFHDRRQFGYLIFRRFARLLCACYAIRSLHFSPGWHWRFQIHYLLLGA